jgi:peptidoglycan/LPS O-acetylase OafA/YrhL
MSTTSAPPRAGPRHGQGRHRHGRERAPTGVYARAATGFAWLRLVGALIVVVDHSGPLTDPARLTAFPAAWNFSPGYFALMGFFAMSGFQIAESWARDPKPVRFALKRALRILPPLVTSLPLRSYFTDPQTWSYVPAGAGLFALQHRLPGVFADNPYPWAVNGSLWTLPMEVTGYALVLALGLLGAFGRFRFLPWLALGGLFLLDSRFQATIGHGGGGGALVKTPVGSTVAFLVAFAAGVVLYVHRDRLPLRPLAAWPLLGAYVAAHVFAPSLDRYLLPLAAGYGAIVLAHHWPSRLARHDEWAYGSYGLYIWAFPIQQLLVIAGLRDQFSLMAAALPLSYLAGVASWFLIERPTLSLRKNWR